jgi:hypothetical protein
MTPTPSGGVVAPLIDPVPLEPHRLMPPGRGEGMTGSRTPSARLTLIFGKP